VVFAMDRQHLLSVGLCLLALTCLTFAQPEAGPTASTQDGEINGEYPEGTSPPKIVEQSEELYVVVPKVATEIKCKAEGVPAPTYRWERDGKDLVLEDPFSLSDGNLAVRRPTEVTNGIYRCYASNQFGVAISNKINFVIAFTDPFIETEKKTYTFTQGDLASIPCNQQDSMPVPSIFWTDDADPGNKIVLDNRVSVDPDFNLRFSNIELGDTGRYQCNVKNDKLRFQILSPVKEIVVQAVDNVSKRTATLVYKPESNVNAFRTETFRLKCIAEGYPTPEITWSKQGEDLPMDRVSFESFGQELVILDVNENDAGTYTCTAGNGFGADTSSSTQVSVKSDPYWLNQPEDINIVIGGDGELVCEAAGIPVPAVTWLVNGQPSSTLASNPRVSVSEGTGGGRVEYTNAMTEDSAVYLCVAQNEHSEIMASGFVNVECESVFPNIVEQKIKCVAEQPAVFRDTQKRCSTNPLQ
jgi:neuronal cell adhesion protein